MQNKKLVSILYFDQLIRPLLSLLIASYLQCNIISWTYMNIVMNNWVWLSNKLHILWSKSMQFNFVIFYFCSKIALWKQNVESPRKILLHWAFFPFALWNAKSPWVPVSKIRNKARIHNFLWYGMQYHTLSLKRNAPWIHWLPLWPRVKVNCPQQGHIWSWEFETCRKKSFSKISNSSPDIGFFACCHQQHRQNKKHYKVHPSTLFPKRTFHGAFLLRLSVVSGIGSQACTLITYFENQYHWPWYCIQYHKKWGIMT